jgi:hypothetical protein
VYALPLPSIRSIGIKNRHIHSARFFELADKPQEIIIIATEEESNLLFDHLQKENVKLFYVKKQVEFGMSGKPS